MKALVNLCTSDDAIRALSCELTEELNVPELNPLQRFAKLTALRRACDEALGDAGTSATEYALRAYPSSQSGTDFKDGRETFRILIRTEYNWERYSADWREKSAKRNAVMEEQKELSKEIRAIEARTLREHPGMQPTRIAMTMTLRNGKA